MPETMPEVLLYTLCETGGSELLLATYPRFRSCLAYVSRGTRQARPQALSGNKKNVVSPWKVDVKCGVCVCLQKKCLNYLL